jgi:uncharacterized protein involved in outer membrane biogenesis
LIFVTTFMPIADLFSRLRSLHPSRSLWLWARRALIVVGLLTLLFLAAWSALPRWLQGSGAALFSQTLGRELTVAEVSFQPWRLALQLQGVKVATATGQDQATALLELERVEAVFSWRSIWHGAPVLESLRLIKPVLSLSRVSAGHYDIDDLLARWAKPNPASANAPDSPMASALYNIELIDGKILLDDRPLGRHHQLTALQLDLPFVSTLAADIAVHVEPKVAGALNGVAFESRAQWLPFAEQGEASLVLQWTGLDLLPYRAYFPDALPLRVQRGVVDADLALTFRQAKGKEPLLSLRGQVNLRDFALQTPAGAPWLAWRDLQLPINKAQPLLRKIELGGITWLSPELALSRDAAGQLWLPTAAAAAQPTRTATELPAWQVSWDRLELNEAALDWRDAAVGPQVALRLEGVKAQVGAVTWPLPPLSTPQKAAAFSFAMRLQPAAARGKVEASRIEGAGSLEVEQLALKWRWQGLALEWLAPYLQAQLPLQVRGQLSGRGELALATPLAADAAARVQLDLRELALQDLRVSALDASAPAVLRVGALSLDRLKLDLAAQQLVAGELVLKQAAAALAREANGAWNFQSLLPVTSAPAAAQTPADSNAKLWSLQLASLLIDSSSAQWRDANAGLALSAEQIRLRVQDLAWPVGGKALPVQLDMKLAALPALSALPVEPSSPANRNVPAQQGDFQWQGQVSLAPLSASGSLTLERLPLQWLDALLDPTWGVHLQQAELGLRSEFSATQLAEGWSTQLSGALVLADLQLQQARQIEGRRVVGEDLLSWQALKLDGLKWVMNPGATPQLTVALARLDDFYARLIVNEGGRLNLRELGPGEPPARAAGAAAVSVAAPALKVTIQQTQLSQGRVDFSDRFIRPNYSAQLTDLTGSLGAFSSGSSDMATLKLRGRVAGTGQLEIEGQVNPGAAPLTLDITGAASDIELAPLSPYAAKYAGYAIEQGKFSSKVHYKIAPTGNLEASNQITLNQLTFGERVESPQATQLPVLLAVALLKDRNGVIDLNLPISGSINDPEFSVGGLLVRVLVNLLGRALTAPFSLFWSSEPRAGPGLGSADMSQATFAPGRVVPLQPEQLDKVARLLQDRPGLKLTLTGWADAATESLALQQVALDAELMALRQRELLRWPGSPAAAAKAMTDGPSQFSQSERARLLKEVYQASKLPDKPRNVLGFAKDIAPAEMRALLLASFPVTDERLRQLALERGVVVRDGLIVQGVSSSRIILATPNLATDASGPAGSPAAKWVPHVALQLGAE